MSGHSSTPRWGQPLSGIIAFIVFLGIALISWIVLASPAGVFKLYEHPFIEFLAWMILVGLWQTIIFGNWPFQKLAPLQRGVVQITINIVATYVIIYGVFQSWLGKTILPLWSVEALVARGIPHETALEYTGGAITMFVLMGFFTYAFWTILFGKWPWAGKLTQPALGLAEWSITTVVTLLAYGSLIYPFYVSVALKQPVAAAAPWWGAVDGVSHLNWVVGIWEWAIVYLFMTANVWSGKPWNLVKKQPWSGLFGLVSIFLLAYITVKVLLLGMGAAWGAVDPKATDGPASLAWRYYHCASLAGFTLFPFLIWNHYFDNWPQKWGTVVGWIVRTVGVFALAAIGYFLYYAVSELVFGLKPELSNHVNKPLVWLFWAIIPLLFNDWFMEKVPFYKPAGETHTANKKSDKKISM
jgi:amino acid transporter, AAT family